jgi:hypothetical protein
MTSLQNILMVLLFVVLCLPRVAIAGSWPGDRTSSTISASILSVMPSFEPSGILWHSQRNSLIVVGDGGQVAEISSSGSLLNSWSISGNWEGITVADASTDLVYLAHENNSAIYAFDLSSGTLTGDSWSVSSYVYPVGKLGFEALTFVPDGFHPYGATSSGGLFYAGWQYDADLYVFDVDLSVSGSITYVDEVRTTSGYSDLSGVTFNAQTGTLFTVYDSYDLVEERATDGTLIDAYTIPSSGSWEGIATIDSCPTSSTGSIVLADDAGSVAMFGGFIYDCLVWDLDGDGVTDDVDCNDADATVSTNQTYWEDVDADGYGNSASTISVCSSVAPVGYVTNAEDLYDTARIEICNDGKDNDGDAQIDEYNTLAENGPHVVYSTYAATTSGYVVSAVPIRSSTVSVTFVDGSCYAYTLYGFPATVTYPIQVSGTSYYQVISRMYTATLNALTGSVSVVQTWFPSVSLREIRLPSKI